MHLDLSEMSQLAPIFRELFKGYHISRRDPELYAQLSNAQDQYRTLFKALGFELVCDTRGFYYFVPDLAAAQVNKTAQRLALFTFILVEHLADQGRDPVAVLDGGSLGRDELPSLLEKYRDLFLQAEVQTQEELEEKIMRRMTQLGFAAEEVGIYRFLPPMHRFLDVCLSVQQDRDLAASLHSDLPLPTPVLIDDDSDEKLLETDDPLDLAVFEPQEPETEEQALARAIADEQELECMSQERYGIRRFALLNTAGYSLGLFPLEHPLSVYGANNLGKSASINALQFPILARMSDMSFGKYSLEQSRRFYFASDTSYILVEVALPHGPHVIGVVGRGPGGGFGHQFFAYAGKLDLAHYQKNDTCLRQKELFTNLESQGLKAYELKPDELRRLLVGGHTSIPLDLTLIPLRSTSEQSLKTFRALFINLLHMREITAAKLKQLFLDAFEHSLRSGSVDYIAACEEAFRDVRRMEQDYNALVLAGPLVEALGQRASSSATSCAANCIACRRCSTRCWAPGRTTPTRARKNWSFRPSTIAANRTPCRTINAAVLRS
jgi:hypothetical protein